MACGRCGGGARSVKPNPTPALIMNTLSSNRGTVSSTNPGLQLPIPSLNGNVIDQDQLRIERLRREAIRRSLGR